MIIDNLPSAHLYESINPHFKTAFNFLKTADLKALPLGKHEVDGKNVFVAVSEYETKSIDAAKFETHENYIDIQFLAEGAENIGVCKASDCVTLEAYNPEKDIAFVKPNSTFVDYVSIHDDVFAVLFPNDAHQPCVARGEKTKSKKIVIKVAVR
ncbi:MAG: YhcH/YjgK/YiaL family protein [Bacteroidales bacterium]|jgi:YhcH/YjgK/YiaL family protein|nr:YhcH/YjgK/YiaL family protein [Bacteroidales bacterium]